MNFSILWQGNPVSVQKSLGTKNCVLCMKERTTILKSMYKTPNLLINNNSEIYGSCRHKPRFHRFSPPSTGTDESYGGRKSSSRDSLTPENSENSTNLDNTHTNSSVELETNSTTEYDLNSSDLSCFPCDSQNYTILAI